MTTLFNPFMTVDSVNDLVSKTSKSMKYPVITECAYREWPDDHPLKQRLPVLPDNMLDAADVVVCSIKGEPRTVPAPDDHDVETTCYKCGVAIVHRASAPDLPKECWRCFAES